MVILLPTLCGAERSAAEQSVRLRSRAFGNCETGFYKAAVVQIASQWTKTESEQKRSRDLL